MTLLEMKKKVLQLIEEIKETIPEADIVTKITELTDDPDIEKKISTTINIIQNELARMKKIPAKMTLTVNNDDLEYDMKTINDFYQLNTLKFKDEDGKELAVDMYDNFVEFPTAGTAKLYYYKYPTTITDTTEDSYEFELSNDALEIMPLGVAGMILMSDVSSGYGQIYTQRYEAMLQRLDPRYNMSPVYIENGIEV
jgi:hypothetical protein